MKNWWSEQENRVYRGALIVLGLDVLVLGLIYGSGYASIGAMMILAALIWD